MSTIRAVFAGILVGFIGSGCLSNRVQGAPPTRSPFFGESLRRTFITLSVEDQTLDQVLLQLLRSINLGALGKPAKPAAELAHRWSIWMDRRIDPNELVTLTAAGSPASEIVLKMAESSGLAAYPLPGVLLIGRPEWVEKVLVNLPSDPRSDASTKKPVAATPATPNPANLVTVQWPTGTPAASVLGMVLSAQSGVATSYDPNVHAATDWLPHDVWKAGRLESVDRSLAVALILAQFDLRLEHGHSLDALLDKSRVKVQPKNDLDDPPATAKPVALPSIVTSWRDADVGKEFLQAYPSGDAALTIRKVLNEQKKRVSVRASGEQLLVRTNAKIHLAVINQLWKVPPKQPAAAKNADQDAAVFDLKLVNKPLATVMQQLAGAAGKKLRFGPGTEQAKEQLINLDAAKRTLKELTEEIATKVGLQVDWNDTEVVVTN